MQTVTSKRCGPIEHLLKSRRVAVGEAVKLVIVKKDPALTEADVRAFCETQLTGYKRPRVVEFRDAMPKTTVGKILRRELRG